MEAHAPAGLPARTARMVSFATLGTLSTTQELAGRALAAMEGADPEQVAEETLCLVATATARAAGVGLRAAPDLAGAVLPALLDLPFTYRDYLVGGAMIETQHAALQEAAEAVTGRLQRMRAFYEAHLPPNQFPGPTALSDKMALWMGRISPPRLPESPTRRLERLDLVPVLVTHLRLILAFARREAGP
ncbi:hypothetical protein GQ464_010100 [Rhodocaloribacter litoris]|uniref:hypothetical protein n=1 Tax=Rhodocaloribacter litoris TaxID=2558931 RepID=UPI00141EE5BB|nr:hypothetical protein [Rhodocaloribacter litoris]QXD13824.1 hypothetical protein GQ464_010100 [Rhodocaloribacter litoris]